jgi:hypothetical protein
MINITTIKGGFKLNETDYLLEGEAEIISETQAHIITDKGIILIDVAVNVDGQQLTTIQELLSYLYK